MARKSTFTKEIGEKIIRGIEDGLTQELACQLARVQYKTVKNWVAAGERDDADDALAQFAANYYRARGIRALRWVKRIDTASQQPENWKAAAWLLETCEREHYGRDKVAADDTTEQLTSEQRLERINRIVNSRRDSGA
jgi:hypothetical protein